MVLAVIPAGGFNFLPVILLLFALPALLGVVFLVAAILVKSRRLRLTYMTGLSLVVCWFSYVAWRALTPALARYDDHSSSSMTSASSGPWLTFMGNEARTGEAAGAFIPPTAAKLWVFRDGVIGSPFGASAAISGGRVLIGADSGKLFCLDTAVGTPAWTFEARHPIFAAPVVSAGRAYIGEGLHETQDAKLVCLDMESGKPLWTFDTTGHIEFSPTVFGDWLYFAAGDDGVYCLDKNTGSQIWRHPGIHVDMSPTVTADAVFVGSAYGETAFYALDGTTGKLRWKRPTPYGVGGSPSMANGSVYFGLGNGNFAMSHADPKGAVWRLNATDGEPIWTKELPDSVLTCVAVSGGSAFFGCRDGKVYCLDADTGDDRWTFDASAPVLSSPAVNSGRVVFGSDTGKVHCLDANTGEPVWEFDTSTESFSADARVLASPAIGDGRIYIGSMNGAFFCLGKAPK